MSDVKPGQRAPRNRPPSPPGPPAEHAAAGHPERPERGGRGERGERPDRGERGDHVERAAARPLAVTGLVAASWCVGIGLAVLTTVTLVGWIAAPRAALGPGLPGVFRTAVNLWLVAHHAGFSLEGGRVGLLPLGLTVLPGALLYRSGGWMIRTAQHGAKPAGVVAVAFGLAVPYAVLAALLALAASTEVIRPSAWQALLACLVLAAVAGGLGAARALVAARGRRVRSGLGALLRLLPERPRSLVVGVLGALGVLIASGAVLAGASLAMHLPEATALFDELAPGVVGGVLLLLVEMAFLPNAVIWGMAYAIGPGFAVGTGTSVSPTGVFLDVVPSFPPLAALPEPGPAPALSLLAVATPFLAGAVGGVLTIRAMPSPAPEAAPLWGFLSGALTGAATAVLAALSGGPMGGGRLTAMGPSPWRVGLMAALEVGIAAAITAWLANWRVLRRSAAPDEEEPEPPRARRPRRRRPDPETPAVDEPAREAPTARKGRGRSRPARRRAPETPAGRDGETASPPPSPRPPSRPPVVADPMEFEEAEPVLTPRRARRPRVREPLEDPREEPSPGRARRETAPPSPEEPSGRRDEPHDEHHDEHQDEPERTETRGGAIYFLRDEPADD